MTHRQRVIGYGSAAALIVVGAICGVIVAGLTGEVIGWTLATLGLGAVVLLVFYEIGLSEDRALAKEEEERRRKQRAVSPRPPAPSRRSGAAWRPRRRP